ncbi:MAG: hypothetical protein F4026_00145 [Synechococcus sp. SB0669_bin_8]|nr:hypothetical protein [Synechococcus sp. SB0669_bin_8]
MHSASTSDRQHWYLKLIVVPLLLTLRSVAAPPRQLPSQMPSSSGRQHWYPRFVFSPLLGLLKSIVVLLTQMLNLIGHVLTTIGKVFALFQRFFVNPLLRSPRFIVVFTSQLLKFNPNRLTPGRYALETIGQWPRRFMKFFPALFHFYVNWGEQRPRFLNRITLLAPVTASLSLFSLAVLKASFLGSFLELHFPENLSVDVVKLPVF